MATTGEELRTLGGEILIKEKRIFLSNLESLSDPGRHPLQIPGNKGVQEAGSFLGHDQMWPPVETNDKVVVSDGSFLDLGQVMLSYL